MQKSKKYIVLAGGFFAGIINGLLGSGGGLIAVPTLKKADVDTKKCHATSIAIIFPISVLSTIIYFCKDRITISDALPYLPAGVVGALLGTWILGKIPDSILRRGFGIFMLWASYRMFFR